MRPSKRSYCHRGKKDLHRAKYCVRDLAPSPWPQKSRGRFKMLQPLNPSTLLQDSQINEVTDVISKAFQGFSASVGASEEIAAEDFGDEEAGRTVIKG